MARARTTGTRLFALALSALAGCATAPDATVERPPSAPLDFTLEVQVLCGPDTARRPEAHLRNSHFIVFSDGALHHGEGVAAGKGLPDLVRRLTPDELDELWGLTPLPEAGGTASAARLDAAGPPVSGVVYAIGVTGGRRRWSHREVSDGPSAGDTASRPLVRRLAELAWVPDRPEIGVSVAPRRYDLGPDPYARYRSP